MKEGLQRRFCRLQTCFEGDRYAAKSHAARPTRADSTQRQPRAAAAPAAAATGAGPGTSARPAAGRGAAQGARGRVPQPSRPAARRPQGNARGRGGKNPRRRIVGVVVLIAVIAVLWYALDTMITLGVGTPRFYNVYVNGVSLRGYTREEGFQMFAELEED